MKIIRILTWASLNPPRSSMGRGKMIVLFFSAEIECNVCKYLEGLSFFGTINIIPVTPCTKTSIYLFKITIHVPHRSHLSWSADGLLAMILAASINAFADFCSPSLAITCVTTDGIPCLPVTLIIGLVL